MIIRLFKQAREQGVYIGYPRNANLKSGDRKPIHHQSETLEFFHPPAKVVSGRHFGIFDTINLSPLVHIRHFLCCAVFAFGFLATSAAQTAFVTRLDLGLGSERKLLVEWVIRQGFETDTASQPVTEAMAQGISGVLGKELMGETYQNREGNIRLRLFTDKANVVQRLQVQMSNPAPGEAYNLKTSFRASGYAGNAEYTNEEDRTHSIFLEKSDRRFTLVESDDGSWLLLNGQMR